METITKFIVAKDFSLEKVSGCGEGTDFKANEKIQEGQEIVVFGDINQDYVFMSISNRESIKSPFENLGKLIAWGLIKQI